MLSLKPVYTLYVLVSVNNMGYGVVLVIQAHKHFKSISEIWPEGRQQLKKVQEDVSASLEKLETREKHLNDCCTIFAEEYKTKKMQLQQAQV